MPDQRLTRRGGRRTAPAIACDAGLLRAVGPRTTNVCAATHPRRVPATAPHPEGERRGRRGVGIGSGSPTTHTAQSTTTPRTTRTATSLTSRGRPMSHLRRGPSASSRSRSHRDLGAIGAHRTGAASVHSGSGCAALEAGHSLTWGWAARPLGDSGGWSRPQGLHAASTRAPRRRPGLVETSISISISISIEAVRPRPGRPRDRSEIAASSGGYSLNSGWKEAISAQMRSRSSSCVMSGFSKRKEKCSSSCGSSRP